MSAASIALEVAEVKRQLVSAQTIQHTLQQVRLHGRRPRRKPLLKLAHKKACKQFAEDNLAKSMNYWNHVLWSDESKVNLFDLDGVQHVWRRPGEEYQENCALPTVKHGGGSIMVWGCMSAAGSGELRFIEGNMDSNMYCDILKQNIMPSLQKLLSNITTPNTPPRWQLPCCWRWRWWSGQALYVSRPEPYWACGASSSRRWRSTMCLASSSCVMSLWRSGRRCQQQPVQLWWSPWPGGLRQSWITIVPLLNIDTLDTVLTCSLRVYSFFVARYLDNNGYMLSYI